MITVAVPSDLKYHKPDDLTYVLSWKINPVPGEDLSLQDCELQRDVVNTFDSVNLKTFDKNSTEVVSYQNGNFFKSFSFNDLRSLEDVDYYYRVRVSSDTYISSWSSTATFSVNKVLWKDIYDRMFLALPDVHTYSKEANSTLVATVLKAYSRELEKISNEKTLTNNDVVFENVRDSSLYDVLGVLLNYSRSSQTAIEYRRELLEFWQSFLIAGTESSIKRSVKALTGMEPQIVELIPYYGWIVHSTQTWPPVGTPDPYEDPDAHYYTKDPLYPYYVQPIIRPRSRLMKGNGFILRIYNPFNITLNSSFIERDLVGKLKPLFSYVNYEYYRSGTTTKGWGNDHYWGNSNYWGDLDDWESYTP